MAENAKSMRRPVVERAKRTGPPVDHDVEFKYKVYEDGRVAADPETLLQLARFSERQIRAETRLRRDIRLMRPW
jgi:hypothetical protein